MNKTLLELLNTVNAAELLFALLLIGILVTAISLNKNKIYEKMNSWRKKENRKDSDTSLLHKTNDRLIDLENQREIDVKQSIRHDNEIKERLEEIEILLSKHIESDNRKTIATLRSTLWRMHRDFVDQGHVTKDGLMTFKEVGKVYEEAGGDDIYHEKLEPEIMALDIRG